ncbi:hypothetical protein EC973_001081 [Apophysomyces ossiformis]|uniref:Uncharacterized protein n=1 Tax=Apophysomyces ossiformis TaxID=679940 RepID=A0A8H7BKW1_9FUNG|nr:hypothetical protein EC973_001081 [Apophysomyces ossiformis]
MDTFSPEAQETYARFFTPLGPSAAAGVVGAIFFILFLVWIYIAIRSRGFLKMAVLRLFIFCLAGGVGYSLRIACNNNMPTATTSSSDFSKFINLYIASSVMTALGNFFLFNALSAVTIAWVEQCRDPSQKDLIARDQRYLRLFTIATLVALILTIVSSSKNDNTLRTASNGIFTALLVILLLALCFFRVEFASRITTSRHAALPIVLFVCTFILLIAEAFKLYQCVAPIGSPALTSVTLTYVFAAMLQLIILIILTISWIPIFYTLLSKEPQAKQESQGRDTDAYPMADPQYKYNNARLV